MKRSALDTLREARQARVMRVDPRELDPFLRLMNENRPCPACGSERVTVRELSGKDGRILRAECSDCGRTYDASRVPD